MNTPDYHWLQADVLTVAPQLLGWELVSWVAGEETAGRIVEVEAYHGLIDAASHAFRGPTPRTLPMFEAGGVVYVYLSYGVHNCINIVTGPAGEGQALLIRALEPTVGADIMSARRDLTNALQLTNGPGKLTQALGIDRSLNGAQLGGILSLRPPSQPVSPVHIATEPRIGISKAVDYPWRFYIANNSFVSRFSRKIPPSDVVSPSGI